MTRFVCSRARTQRRILGGEAAWRRLDVTAVLLFRHFRKGLTCSARFPKESCISNRFPIKDECYDGKDQTEKKRQTRLCGAWSWKVAGRGLLWKAPPLRPHLFERGAGVAMGNPAVGEISMAAGQLSPSLPPYQNTKLRVSLVFIFPRLHVVALLSFFFLRQRLISFFISKPQTIYRKLRDSLQQVDKQENKKKKHP